MGPEGWVAEVIVIPEPLFTEGPWKSEISEGVGEDAGLLLLDISNVSYDADDDGRLQDYGHSLLEGGGLVLENEAENRANARLIGASPEMFLALRQALVEEAHGVGCKAIARSRPNACDCWLSAVPGLLAAVTGEAWRLRR